MQDQVVAPVDLPKAAHSSVSVLDCDYEAFTTALADIDGRTTLLAPEKSSWKLSAITVGDGTLQVMREGGANNFEGSIPEHTTTIAIALGDAQPIHTNGVEMGPGRLVLMRPNEQITTYSSGVCNYCTLSMSCSRLEEVSNRIDPSKTEALLSGTADIAIPITSWRQMADGVARLHKAFTSEDQSPCALPSAQMMDELIATFVDAATGVRPGEARTGRPQVSRQRIVNSVREFLNTTSSAATSIADMARYAGVSERTLRNVVLEQFGVSPKRLLIYRQISDMRRAILSRSPEDTVTSIASKLGIWEFGRLARRYQQVYDESPSDTLRNS